MEFKEWLEDSEADNRELIAAAIDENLLTTPLAFVAGAGGNLISQAGRAAGNAALGLAKGSLGLGQGALGAAQLAGGGKKQAGKTFRKAGSNISSGVGRIARGAAQAVGALSGVSPVLRGAQMASEPAKLSGVYAPAGKGRTWTQDLLGLNSWESPEAEKKIPAKPQSQNVPAKSGVSPKVKEKLVLKAGKGMPKDLENLIADFRAAKNPGERNRILAVIAMRHGKWYSDEMAAARARASDGRGSLAK